MIRAYVPDSILHSYDITAENLVLLKEAIWIDLISPTEIEETWIEQAFKIDVPSQADMQEIELSSRLYREDNALFMTVTMLAQSDSPEPKYDAVAFVLTEKQLITIRYIEPQSFKMFTSRVAKLPPYQQNATGLLVELLDVTIDRLADILEVIGHSMEEYSLTIFHSQHDHHNSGKTDYQKLMEKLGYNGDVNTKARESLMMFNRLIRFFMQNAGRRIDDENRLRLTTLRRDIESLSDHANFLSNKITFLLDATLGMVNIEQNDIIKIFSVAAVIFLPPTLIASIYGMNFHLMPELNWKWGYLVALGLMLISAILPYVYFKRRKWL